MLKVSRRDVVVGGLCSAAAVFSGRLSALAQEAPAPANDVSASGRQFLAEHAAVDMHAHPGRFFLADPAMLDASLRSLASTVVPETLAGMRRGMIAAAVFNTVADVRTLTLVPPGSLVAARTFAAGQAYDDHRAQVAAFTRLAASGAVRQVSTAADIEAARRAGVVGGILGSEGADFLEGRLDRLAEARRDGVRVIGLVHYRSNELGDVQTVAEAARGLTPFGESVVREMNRLGMVIDLAHAAPEVLRKAAAISTAPMIVSHVKIAAGGGQNARTLDPADARRVAEAGGVIGAWPAGIGIATFDEFIDEILRYVDLLGVEHVGLGTDMDANYKPVFTDYADLPRIPATLLRRGMRPGEVAQVVGGNFQRVFSAVCGK